MVQDGASDEHPGDQIHDRPILFVFNFVTLQLWNSVYQLVLDQDYWESFDQDWWDEAMFGASTTAASCPMQCFLQAASPELDESHGYGFADPEDDACKVPKGWWDDAGVAPTRSSFQGFTFAVDETPEKLPQPMKKRQLSAAKRLELQLQSQKVPKVPEQNAEVPFVKPTSKARAKPTKATKAKKNETCEKPTRKPADGPMTTAMKAFMESTKKDKNIKHSEAVKLWMKSKERNSIIEALPQNERKRRRFEK
eukprot:s308_g23.t1